ncbi:MAG: phosphatidylserine/phosphatidylglycerophosphate/cardiolipin synthase family protein, partial [Anaerolinea sp.]|nr:phosphatidylserine/phosphatidylglycerophosphate/cardiolipin synthase family protein [Anaerolinea sp.]
MITQQGFDIDSLLRFTPPGYLCERCHALLVDVGHVVCPVCGVQYIATEKYPMPGAYLRSKGLDIHFNDLIEHSQQLARIARKTRESVMSPYGTYPPIRALFEALQNAQKFVHFTTYGISVLILGALKLTAQSVDVRGIVSGIKHDMVLREITEYREEAPRMKIQLFPNDSPYFPHQKIVVIDGLLAFKGSANLTDFAWRKAAQGREVIEPVTDVNEVIELHNRYFSPVWAVTQNVER